MISEIKLRFGKYKGRKIKDVPIDYLKWCVDKDVLRGKALFYAKIKTGHPKDKYKVTVKDSIGGDGEYIVEAYNDNHAMSVCKRQNNIQCTQSFHGTIFSVNRL